MKPILDWSAYHESGMGDAYADIPKEGGDFARAVAVCINSKQCEKKGKGVMCPSFRVSDNPAMSTGGRVRLLKQALNGKLSLDDRALAKTMELCLACKGCKRECENEVDMAMIKIEYLAQRHSRESPDLRTRLIAGLPEWLARHPGLKALIAWRNRSRSAAWLGERLFGIAADVPLPEPVTQPARESGVSEATEVVGEIVMLHDTFSRQFAPGQFTAARQVLLRAGYRVFIVGAEGLSEPLCCGRTQLAHGLVEQAKSKARRMIEALLPHVEAGRTVVGLEPACLLAVRDDYRFLGLGEAAGRVADACLLFEEFISRESMAGRFGLSFEPYRGEESVMVHGHCHQKAVGAMKAMRRVLKLVPELRFEMIDATCCGMAGSFGIEAEHAAMAKDMAEDGLLPALRAAPKAPIVANGFSCRHQISSCAQRTSRHVAELLASQLPA